MIVSVISCRHCGRQTKIISKDGGPLFCPFCAGDKIKLVDEIAEPRGNKIE